MLYESDAEGKLQRKTSLTKPVVLPEKYNGKTIQHFEACATVNDWNKEQKAQFLALNLVGPARELLQGVFLKSSIAYSMLLRCLRERYGPGAHSHIHRSLLRARRQKEREGPRELGQEIRTLARRAYHDMTAIELEFLAKDHFNDALPD